MEVLPYVLSALIAAVVVPAFLYSQVPGTKAAVIPYVASRDENILEIIRQDHAAFVPDPMLSDSSAKMAGDRLAYRSGEEFDIEAPTIKTEESNHVAPLAKRFPRPFNNSRSPCIPSKAKECPPMRLTMSSQPMKKSGTLRFGKSDG